MLCLPIQQQQQAAASASPHANNAAGSSTASTSSVATAAANSGVTAAPSPRTKGELCGDWVLESILQHIILVSQ